jgi:hypothetical protein
MPAPPAAPAAPTPAPTAPKPPWRYAAERRLGRVARRLVGTAEPEIPHALAIVGPDAALAASRHDGWALACLERAADCDDGSEAQGAWVLLAACRPTLVRRAIHGEPPTNRRTHKARDRAANRNRPGVGASSGMSPGEATDGIRR